MKQILFVFFLVTILSIQTGYCQIHIVKISTHQGISVEDYQVCVA